MQSFDSVRAASCGQRSPVRLNASTGGAGPLPALNGQQADPVSVVDVTIDTGGMRAPAVLLRFSSIVSLPAGVSATLHFEITRRVYGGAPGPVGPTYTFSKSADLPQAESFGFQHFDTALADGRYTYAVRLSTNSVIDAAPGLAVNNATLSALAVDQSPV